jgi:DNA-binding protein
MAITYIIVLKDEKGNLIARGRGDSIEKAVDNLRDLKGHSTSWQLEELAQLLEGEV